MTSSLETSTPIRIITLTNIDILSPTRLDLKKCTIYNME